MSEEKNNVEMIPEFKMYITDLETEKDSKEIDVFDLIFDDYIEFQFGNYEDEDYATLPYKDFKFFINDYSITIYSPQMKKLQNQLQQKENIIKEVRERAKRELKIAEENIKNSEQWLEIEEEQEHAKKDIHTGKVVKRYMEIFLEILDKGE